MFFLAAFLLACSGQYSVHALVFPQPQPTISLDALQGWTPKPTEAARAGTLGAVPLNDLFARQDANSATCGWYSGDPNRPITCPRSTDGCAYYHSSIGGFGCCQYVGPSPATTACPYVSACLDYTDSGNWNSGNAVGWSPPSIACPSNLPYCVTTKLFGTSSSSFFQFGCGTTATTTLAYQTTSDTTSTTSSTSSTSTSTTTLVSSILSTISSTPSASASSSPSGLSSGASTGIGVGVGVGCLIAGIAIGYYCLRRKKASQKSSIAGFNDNPWQNSSESNYRIETRSELDNTMVRHNQSKHGATGISELESERPPQELDAHRK